MKQSNDAKCKLMEVVKTLMQQQALNPVNGINLPEADPGAQLRKLVLDPLLLTDQVRP